MPAADGLPELRDEEYAARLEVTRLRRALYEDAQVPSPDLLGPLAGAEARLREAEDARRAAQAKDSTSGVIVDTDKEPALLGPDTTGLKVKLTLRLEFVPTAIAHLMTAADDPLVSCSVSNVKPGTRRLRVTSYIDGYSAAAVDTVELKEGEDHTFDQLPVMRPEATRHVTEMTRAMLNVLVENLDAGGVDGVARSPIELHRSLPLWLLARTSAPLVIQDPTGGEPRDMTPYFGAFVTPNAPAVMEFLSTATAHHPDKQLIGYQGDPSKVEPQVQAVFEALKHEGGIRYVNSVLTSSPDEGFADQRIRLPRESLAERSANCIDGTVLYASLLEAASMNPAIVVVPGHAFLAWETWAGSGKWQYLETTMTGNSEFEAAREAAEATAAHYTESDQLVRHPIRTLRTVNRIVPME